MPEEEKYRRKTELLKRALQFAEEMDQADAESDNRTSNTNPHQYRNENLAKNE